jgi:hypothetical protein
MKLQLQLEPFLALQLQLVPWPGVPVAQSAPYDGGTRVPDLPVLQVPRRVEEAEPKVAERQAIGGLSGQAIARALPSTGNRSHCFCLFLWRVPLLSSQ